MLFQINTNFSDGKSALHIAVSEGLVNVIEVLLEFKPDLNITVRLFHVYDSKIDVILMPSG